VILRRVFLFTLGLLFAAFSCLADEPSGEVHIREGGANRIFEIVPFPKAAASASGPIYLFEKGIHRTESSRRLLTERILVRLVDNAGTNEAARLAAKYGATTRGELNYSPGAYIFKLSDASRTLSVTAALRGEQSVRSADPILAHSLMPRFVPNDTYFTNEWHLLNTGQRGATPGADINVTNVWETYRGAGVTVAVLDDGLLYTHPDLAPNVNVPLGIDVRSGDSDPAPEGSPGVDRYGEPRANSHGTAVSGILAARGNNGIGVTGVAFEATLVGVRLLGGLSGDDEEGGALSYKTDVIQIMNNSWGSYDDGETLGGAGDLALQAIEHGAKTGRGGKGVIYVFAGGNGGELDDNANFDTYVNSIYTIGVGAINDRGQRASYSEPGSCLVVSAPGGNDAYRFQGITTTDLLGEYGYNYVGASNLAIPELDDTDYSEAFNGTSAATPMVSGVAALMLQANPDLGWRDVQEILMRSATKTNPTNSEWFTNSAGIHFNPNFGAGLVNADAAVSLAKGWTNLGFQTNVTSERIALDLPVDEQTVAETTFDLSGSNLRVEHVTVHINASASARGNLQVTLESPSGTISPVAEPRDDDNPDYDYTFMSLFNWGENSAGTWKLRVSDVGWYPPDLDYPNILHDATLVVYGTLQSSAIITGVTLDSSGIHVNVSGEAGASYELQSTTDFINWTSVNTLVAPAPTFTISAAAAQNLAFFRVRTLEK
jgi:subtilisin family serine protease